MPPPYIIALSASQNDHCYYCQLPMRTEPARAGTVPPNQLTKDHYLPRCYGGPTEPHNLVAACGQCNWIRGSLDAETFAILVEKWFRQDPQLRDRWHSISRQEFLSFKRECEHVDKVKWQRRIKRCPGARSLHQFIPIPIPPHRMRA